MGVPNGIGVGIVQFERKVLEGVFAIELAVAVVGGTTVGCPSRTPPSWAPTAITKPPKMRLPLENIMAVANQIGSKYTHIDESQEASRSKSHVQLARGCCGEMQH
jgi:hypothetical protein